MTYTVSTYGGTPNKIDFENGSISQWAAGGGQNGIADGATHSELSGRQLFASSYAAGATTILPNAGASLVGFATVTANPPLSGTDSDRAEGHRWVDWSTLDGTESWITLAICLPGNFNWSGNWTGSPDE